ncbi:MAG: heavy metal translocating P-type ATPase, partial [Ignavibacteria bacterium]
MHKEIINNIKDEALVELDIEGMECPGCAMKIENTLSKLNGVESVKVDLGTDTASIKFDKNALDLDSIKSEIYGLGYKAIEPGLDIDEAIIEKEKKLILKKFKIKILVSIILSVLIVVLGMKVHISFLDKISMEAANWISLPLSTIVVFWCGMKFLRGFWAAMKNRTADMDTLIAIGTLSAYLYSAVVMVFPHISGDTGHSVYFESAAMIITFILIGNYLEANLKNKTQYAIKSLTNLQSKNATVIKNGNEYEIPIKNVKQNDIVVVKPGERIPVDGSVTEGISTVDESMVTGESIPSEKANGKKVIGGTMNLDGYLKIKTEKVGKETFLSKIINLVKDAQKSKPKIQRIADKVSAVFVPIVIVIAVGTFAVWNFLIEEGFAYSLLKAVAVLIIACPCALGLATPIAIVLGVGRAAENKILFNNAEAIENVNKVNTIVFDKTGTLTYAKFEVGRIHLTPTLSEGVGDSTTTASSKGEENSKGKVVREKRQNNLEYEILKKAASIENYSEHPIARAIV